MSTANIDYSPLSRRYSFIETWRSVRDEFDKNDQAINTVLDRSTSYTFLFNLYLIFNPIIALVIWIILVILCAITVEKTGALFILITALTLYPLYSIHRILLGVKPFLRYTQFALLNQITLLEFPSKEYRGMIFKSDVNQVFAPGFQFNNKANTRFGNLEWYSDSERRISQGFLCIELSRKLPHTVLDANGNNLISSISNLPVNFKRNQKLSLEGDFDKYFTLYCPENYERDTLYWLTPELMNLLVTHLSSYDIEIIDNSVYLYPNGKFELDEETIKNLYEIGDWLYYQFEDNTHRYKDERIASFTKNLVTKPGRQLKQRISRRIIIDVIWLMLIILWIIYY